MSTIHLSPAVSIISFLLVLSAISSCTAQNQSCLPSSCGNIHDIHYPFRLKTDPRNCGRPGFELDCQNNNTIISFKSKRFNVLAISYDNYTIRLVDPGLDRENSCSFPNKTFNYNEIPSIFTTIKPGKVVNDFIDLNTILVFISCGKPLSSPRFINATFCSNRDTASVSNSSKIYSYVTLANDFTVSEFDESCNVEKEGWASVRGPISGNNRSLSDIHDGLVYGFELSWNWVLCDACASGTTCIVLESGVTCKRYCYEDTPFEERTFRCKLEYYAVYIFIGVCVIGGILGLRLLFGLCCLAGAVRYQWKRRHLSVDGNIKDFRGGRS